VTTDTDLSLRIQEYMALRDSERRRFVFATLEQRRLENVALESEVQRLTELVDRFEALIPKRLGAKRKATAS